MDARKFLKEMTSTSLKRNSKLSANEYFDTAVGKKMIDIISKKVRIIDGKSFTLQDGGIIKGFQENPLYMGRDFFADMKELGFICEIISYHDEEAPVKTYLFKAD